MERKYSESELRERLDRKAGQIAKDLVGRLRDDNFFKTHSLDWSGTLLLDGKPVSNWESFSKIFSDSFEILLPELLSELMVALFEEDETA